MNTLHVGRLKHPLRVFINNTTEQILYCGGEHYEWLEIPITDLLRDDITKALKISRPMLWKHGYIELYSDGENIRARKPGNGMKNENRT
jgi:hypothetical protein